MCLQRRMADGTFEVVAGYIFPAGASQVTSVPVIISKNSGSDVGVYRWFEE